MQVEIKLQYIIDIYPIAYYLLSIPQYSLQIVPPIFLLF